MKLKDISTKYLLTEYYLQNFTYIDSNKEINLYNLIKKELQRRKGTKHEDDHNRTD